MLKNVLKQPKQSSSSFMEQIENKLRESRLRWYGHVMRRDDDYIGRRMIDMELPGKRKRGRPKRRYMDMVNEDMRALGLTRDDAGNRELWRKAVRCGDP